MFPLIETAAAFAAVMLVVSLFVSALVQAIQSRMKLRAAGLTDMLLTLVHNYTRIHGIDLDDDGEKAFVEAIVAHPLLHSRGPRRAAGGRSLRPIEYLDQNDLIDLVRTEMKRTTKSAKAVKKAVSDVEQFTRFVERWYETVGATASQHFKHRMRQLTLLVSGAVVVIFNFDGLHLIADLHRDDAQRAALTREIAAIHDLSRSLGAQRAAGDEGPFVATPEATLQTLALEMKRATELLGEPSVEIGWQSSFIARRWHAYRSRDDAQETHPTDGQMLADALLWLAGLAFSCVMLSLGAPFWATTLGSLVNITNAVQKAKSGAGGDAPKDQDKEKDREKDKEPPKRTAQE
jgi:hypothetical protein